MRDRDCIRPTEPTYRELNFCTACGRDFTSERAFDLHRAGRHAYTNSEGLRLDPPREDGRRCRDADELREHGLELRETKLGVERWGLVLDDAQKAQLAGLSRAA